MKIQEFLRLVSQPIRTNYFAVCSDQLGLGILLQGALSSVVGSEDLHFFDAENVTKEKARQIEQEARYAPRVSKHTIFYLYRLQALPTESVGPLLKAVEEAAYSRFIFQAQDTPTGIHTLMSRSVVAKLPFLSRRVVLGNMKAMNHDARTADQLDLYDGTLSGTIRNLSMKDSMTVIQRDLKAGQRGLVSLFSESVLGSNAFDPATQNHFNMEEQRYLRVNRTPARQKIALYLAAGRVS